MNKYDKHFIVEKMEVVQKQLEPDVINMTIRKDPDGLIPETGKKLKALIESLDPDAITYSDYNIGINVNNNNTVERAIYMMSARGNGKTQYVSEQIKKSCKGGFSYANSDGRDFRHMYPIMRTGKINITVDSFIKDVIFNDPATIVLWVDGSKTVVKCQKGETFDPEKGLAMAISKKVLGNDYDYYETFAKHVGRYNKKKFNKALEEAKKKTPGEIIYNGKTYVLENKEE